jgi:translation initiation factor IF-2
MAKIRVHELAKELNIPSKEMVVTLQNLGLDVKNHMSTMEDSQAQLGQKKTDGTSGSRACAEKNEAAPRQNVALHKSHPNHRPGPNPNRQQLTAVQL